jgi:hypothetical protein
VKRDIVPYIRTTRTSKAICRCQIIELCCHWHSFNRMIHRHSARKNCVLRERLCSQCYHRCRIDSVGRRYRWEGVWIRHRCPCKKSMGSPLVVLLVLDYIREPIDAKQWAGLKKAWRVLKISCAGCVSTPFALNRELETSENFWKSCRRVKCMSTATSRNEPSLRTVSR